MNKKLCPECYAILITAQNPMRRCGDCGWMGDYTKSITEYTTLHINIDRIFSDGDFNCRGRILPMDVVDLAQDIERVGLQFPIAVQPAFDVSESLPEGFDFRIVAGHRRFEAFKLLKKDVIPAMVKVGLTEVKARLLNLGENLKRKALNITQEANAIKRLKELGLNRRQVSEFLGVSTSWVQVRYNLLDLPEEIQEAAAAGILNQYQIKQVYSLSTKNEQFEAVKKIKEAAIRGDKGISVSKSVVDEPHKKRRQAKNVVREMMDHMGTTIGFGLHTRVLAWANGDISSAEIFMDIAEYADQHAIKYEIPTKVTQDA